MLVVRYDIGRFEPARVLSAGARFDHVRGYGRDRLIAVGTRGDRYPYRTHRGRAFAAFGRLAEGFARSRELGPRGLSSYVVALDVNRSGDAAVLLTVSEADRGPRIGVPYLVVRRAGRSFGRPLRLSTGGPSYGDVAVNDRGDVLVTWRRPVDGTTGEVDINARLRTAGGRLGSVRRIGGDSTATGLSAGLGDDRRAVVAWSHQALSEGEAGGAIVRAAAAPAGGRFGRARVLETVRVNRYIGGVGVRAAVARDGRPIVAWTGVLSGRFVVRAASVEGSRVGPAQLVSDPAQETVLSDLATGPRGEAVFIGLQGPRGDDSPGPVSLVAAARAPGAAAFGAPEVIEGPGRYVDPRAAFDPATGRAVVVWTDFGRGAAITSASREPLP